MGIFAQPLEVIDRRRGQALARIAELVANYEVETLVVGRPVRLNGSDGPAVEAIEKFVGALTSLVSVPVQYQDERLTTAEAQRAMIGDGVRRADRRVSIDKVAAALILQSYLDARA
jgi:putative Holliday junction resolvase